jgi:phosphoribosylaminoimidazole carboxylase
MAHVTVTASSHSQLRERLRQLPFAEDIAERPDVGIIMGSDSDLPSMQAAADILTQFGVPYE